MKKEKKDELLNMYLDKLIVHGENKYYLHLKVKSVKKEEPISRNQRYFFLTKEFET
jgi:hypothetical protein